MKKMLLVLLTIVIISGFIIRSNNNPAAAIANLAKKGKINPGNLVYKIYFMGIIPVGEAVIKRDVAETYGGQEVYHLSAAAKSAKYFSSIFKATAELDSYINRQTLNPIFYKQKTVISNKGEIKKEIIYDQQNSIMTIGSTRRQILPNTQDPLSVVYNLKRIDFDKTNEFKFSLNTNQKNYIMACKSVTKQTKIGNKIFNFVIIEAEIKRNDGNPHHKSYISMALLKEKENIPVLIKISASGAIINAKLTAIE